VKGAYRQCADAVAIRRITYIHDERPETCALRESRYGSNRMSLSTSRSLGWDSLNSRAISREILHFSRPTAQLWHLHCTHSYSSERSACTSAVGVHFLSRKEHGV